MREYYRLQKNERKRRNEAGKLRIWYDEQERSNDNNNQMRLKMQIEKIIEGKYKNK